MFDFLIWSKIVRDSSLSNWPFFTLIYKAQSRYVKKSGCVAIFQCNKICAQFLPTFSCMPFSKINCGASMINWKKIITYLLRERIKFSINVQRIFPKYSFKGEKKERKTAFFSLWFSSKSTIVIKPNFSLFKNYMFQHQSCKFSSTLRPSIISKMIDHLGVHFFPLHKACIVFWLLPASCRKFACWRGTLFLHISLLFLYQNLP